METREQAQRQLLLADLFSPVEAGGSPRTRHAMVLQRLDRES